MTEINQPAVRSRRIVGASPVFVPRALHPGAWWLWALGLATAASWTSNPLLLLLILAVAGCVVVTRRSSAAWSDAYAMFLRIGFVVLAIRVVVQCFFGTPIPGHVLVQLPELQLPSWMAGVHCGGPITAEEILAASYEGLRLAVLLACIGAANALANPYRLLKCLPSALYEAGVAIVIAMSFAPQAAIAVRRVADAQQLRARHRWRITRLVIPVLETALDQSLRLAASMDSRGYGRRAGRSTGAIRLTGALLLGGLIGIGVGMYGLLNAGSAIPLSPAFVLLGALLAASGLAVSGRRVRRTRYRPDSWSWPEWIVVGSGAVVAISHIAGAFLYRDIALHPPISPLAFPPLPLLPLVGSLVGLLPAVAMSFAMPHPISQQPSGSPDTSSETPTAEALSA